ncbi:molecular chaperone Hsp60 [Methanosalsum natronophilum]|uniref:Molecular chaperone Hsp60 n=1 Tax=Methanosalsum natronophilum TaxID=768733 RepID=A0A424Z0E3_9EURY|nr:MAG: molecular chaperone Hsp60 [Methanosalsum natronophilum]
MSSMDALVQNVKEKIGIENDVDSDDVIDHIGESATKICDLLSSSYGPKGMNKMIINPVDDVYLTNDGTTIIEESDILNPVVTSLKDLANSMDKTCGDGTKLAVIFAAILLKRATNLFKLGVHPSNVIKGYRLALNKTYDMLEFESFSAESSEQIYAAVLSAASGKSIDIKLAEKITEIMVDIAENLSSRENDEFLDLEEHVKIIKKVGSPEIQVISGVLLDEKPARKDMPTSISNPKTLSLIGDLKFENKFINPKNNIKLDHVDTYLQVQDKQKMILNDYADKIIESGANVVFCEGDVEPLIESKLAKHKILLFKKLKTKDLARISKATDSTIASIKDTSLAAYVGNADRIEVNKKCDEYFVYLYSPNNLISSILIWEPSRYLLSKIEEAVDDALNNAIFLIKNRMIVNGGGGVEFNLSKMIQTYSTTINGKENLAVNEYSKALEDISKILAQNTGMNPIDSSVKMSNYYNQGKDCRVDISGIICENNPPIYDCAAIKKLALISATESAINVLRIDSILAKR